MAGEKKKVGIFLRVSTKQQVNRNDNNEVDLPTQRNACMRLVEQHPDWEFVKEYQEVGSAYNNSFEHRDKLMEANADIENGIINVFVCFMFDRIGRIEQETPAVVEHFVVCGAEVWSTKEGQRTFDNHTDTLLNYLTFWQAGGESKKTSIRVTEAMTTMAEEGKYLGGKPPYGYKRIDTGGTTKKGLPQRTFAINEEEAVNVRIMYQLSAARHYGCHRIAAYLNERGITTRNGKQWGNASIANILRNPIYKGYKAYNRSTTKASGVALGEGRQKKQRRQPKEIWTLPKEPNPDWVIIPEDIWEEVQRIRDAVVLSQKEQQRDNLSIDDRPLGRTKLLFIGYTYCGCCGSKMNTAYSPYRWKTADGVTHRRDNPVYKCTSQASGKLGCTGKASYKQEWIEGLVLEEITAYMSRLQTVDLTAEVERIKKQNTAQEQKLVTRLTKETETLEKEHTVLENEVLKSLMGESDFDNAMLNRLLREKGEALSEKRLELQQAEQALRQRQLEQADLLELQSMIPVWKTEFEAATVDERKVMLSKIIKRITVEPEQVTVEVNLTFQQFLRNAEYEPLPPDTGDPGDGESLTRNLLNQRPHRHRQRGKLPNSAGYHV